MKPISQFIFVSIALTLLTFGNTSCNTNRSENAPVPTPYSSPQQQSQVQEKPASFQSLASFSGIQVTGVTESKDGRKFANFPRWRQGVPFSVVEIKQDGSYVPYPDASWNNWTGQPRDDGFTCVQSVVAHGNSLFVLDPSNPEMKGVVGRPTLFEFDLATNTLLRSWNFDEKVAPLTSYLNDLRIDDQRNLIYITESGLGALIVLDMKTGVARRVLAQSPTTKSEPVVLRVNSRAIVNTDGLPQKFNADGIALDKGYLYYRAITATHLYRISTADLANTHISEKNLETKIQDLGETPMPDGMIFDQKGNLYMGDLQNNAIVYRTPQGEVKTLVQDPNLHWADTFTLSADGKNLIFTDSHLDEAGPQQPASGIVFNIYQVPLPQ